MIWKGDRGKRDKDYYVCGRNLYWNFLSMD